MLASAVLFATVAAPHLLLWTLNSGPPLPPPTLNPQILVGTGWKVADRKMVDWQPAFHNPSAEMHVTLEDGVRRIGVYIAYYRQQNYDRKLVSSDNVLVKSEDKSWAQVERSAHAIILDGQTATVRKGRLRSAGGDLAGPGEKRLTAYHWYWINGKVTASDYMGKALLAQSRLMGQGDDSAAVALYAPEDQPGGADAALEAFLASRGGSIASLLAEAKRQR